MTKYDTKGNPYNILISYVKCDNFIKFSHKYEQIIENYAFDYTTIKIQSDLEFNNENNEICVKKSEHIRNGKSVFIYHILIHLTNAKKIKNSFYLIKKVYWNNN